MTYLEQTLFKEIATLPDTRLADVLAFVRYLKLSLPNAEAKMEMKFNDVLQSIRIQAKKINITEEDINEEIKAVRAKHANSS